MTAQVLRGRLVTGGAVLEDGYVEVADGRVTACGPVSSRPDRADLPRPLGTLLPGLVDTHCHGGGGASVTSGEPGQVRAVAAHHEAAGTTALLASTVTDSPERMLAAVRAACADPGPPVRGVHLEGPFLSPERRGAHDPRHLLLPDRGLARELVAAGEGQVRAMTLAPELPGADGVIDLLEELGVVAAVGHTAGDAATVTRALSREAPGLVTHLFNGMPPLHHRSPGPVAAALSAAARGSARVELVADGVHLADDVVRMVFDLLGPDRVVLVTDAMAAAGMPDGDYRLGPQAVTVRGGVARTAVAGDGGEPGAAEQSIAGGTACLLDVVRRCVQGAGVPLVDAVTAATRSPAVAHRLSADVGELAVGRRADVLVVDEELRAVRVMAGGRWVR